MSNKRKLHSLTFLVLYLRRRWHFKNIFLEYIVKSSDDIFPFSTFHWHPTRTCLLTSNNMKRKTVLIVLKDAWSNTYKNKCHANNLFSLQDIFQIFSVIDVLLKVFSCLSMRHKRIIIFAEKLFRNWLCVGLFYNEPNSIYCNKLVVTLNI